MTLVLCKQGSTDIYMLEYFSISLRDVESCQISWMKVRVKTECSTINYFHRKLNLNTSCLSALAEESSPVKIWPVEPLTAEKSRNFLSPWCILHNLFHSGRNIE